MTASRPPYAPGLGPARSSLSVRSARGQALRARLPRSAQGTWVARGRRQGLVGLLLAEVEGRRADLLPIRWQRMAESPFTFFRGAAALMAADVGPLPTTGLEVQACGDAHLLNLGAYAAPDGHLVFDLNDFDETCRGPFEWDLKRLAASLVVGGRVAGHRDQTCLDAVRTFVRGYREHLGRFARMRVLELARLELTPAVAGRALSPIFTAAARTTPERLLQKATVPTAGGGARFRRAPPLQWPVDGAAARPVLRALADYRSTLSPGRQQVLDAYAPAALAFRVVGTGSVGVEDYLVLLQGNGPHDPLFLQVKEEDRSCWRPWLAQPRRYLARYPHQGRRAAEGQFRTQTVADPFLGWTRIAGKDFLVRQWSDHKAGLDVRLLGAPAVLAQYADLCGQVLAKAHARTGDAAALAGYCGRGGRLDAALARFALAYADQCEADHEAFRAALAAGRLTARRR